MSAAQSELAVVAIYIAALGWPWVVWLIGIGHLGKAVKAAHRKDDERTERQERWLASIEAENRDGPVDHYARAVAELALDKARKRETRVSDDSKLTLVLWILLGGYAAYHASVWSLGWLR
jgi:hypothetical protein